MTSVILRQIKIVSEKKKKMDQSFKYSVAQEKKIVTTEMLWYLS